MAVLAMKEMKPIWRRLRISVPPIKISTGENTSTFKSGTCFPRVKVHFVELSHGTLVVIAMVAVVGVAVVIVVVVVVVVSVVGEAVVLETVVVAVRSVTSAVLCAAEVAVVFVAVALLLLERPGATSDAGVPMLPTGGFVVSVLLAKEKSLSEVCTILTSLDLKKVMKLSTVAVVVTGTLCGCPGNARLSTTILLLCSTPGSVSVMSAMSTCTEFSEFTCVTTKHCCAALNTVGPEEELPTGMEQL